MTSEIHDPQNIWRMAKNEIRTKISSEFFATNVENMELSKVEDGKFVFLAEDSLATFFITTNYKDVISESLFHAAGYQIDFEIRTRIPLKPLPAETENANFAVPEANSENGVPEENLGTCSVISANTFESFVRGPENEMALAASLGLTENLTNPNSPTPLFIYGPSGVGKTHLLHAIANRVLKQNPRARVCYVSSETFVNDFIASFRPNNSSQTKDSFLQRYRNYELLLVDDIQFLEGKEKTIEAFFHMFNAIVTKGGKVVLTSDRPAHEIKLDVRMLSRFQQGISCDINPPCFETRVAILMEKASQQNFESKLFPNSIDFIAKRITRNVRNLEGALNTLSNYVKVKNCSDLPFDILEKLLGNFLAQEGAIEISADFIQQHVAKYFELDPKILSEKKRTAKVAFARMVAMYLCCELTDLKLVEIGDAFGGRDHGTVIHARNTIIDRIDSDAIDKRIVELLREKISAANPL